MLKLLLSAFVSLLLMPALSFADNTSWCTPYSFLSQGFNINNYNQCQILIHKCPTQGPYLDQACVSQTVAKAPVCSQLQSMSTAIKASPSMITVKPTDKFAVVTVTFPGDGQEQHYLMSPKGCMADTSIDPRKLDTALAKQYQTASFMTVNWGEPVFQTNQDETSSFTVVSRVTDKCLACAVIGWAKLKFDFKQDGSPLKASVVSFGKDKPTVSK